MDLVKFWNHGELWINKVHFERLPVNVPSFSTIFGPASKHFSILIAPATESVLQDAWMLAEVGTDEHQMDIPDQKATCISTSHDLGR